MALREAHKTAVRTDRDVDYNLLSELLLRRIGHGEDRHIRAGLDKAAEIVDDISDEGLEGLTVAYAIESYIPVTGHINVGIKILNDLFSKLIDNNKLPADDEWLDHLDILDAVRVSSFGSLKKLGEFYPEIMDGYVAVGILKDSNEYNKAVEILNKVGLLEQGFFVDNELIDGYVRIPIPNHGHIPDISVVIKESDGSLKTGKAYKLNDEQVKALKDVFNLYDKDASKVSSVKEKFMTELRTYPTLKKLKTGGIVFLTRFRLLLLVVFLHMQTQKGLIVIYLTLCKASYSPGEDYIQKYADKLMKQIVGVSSNAKKI